MIEGEPDASLRVFVVWVPKMRASEEHAMQATWTVVDERATHYWDRRGVLMEGYRNRLGLDEDAWDMYMVFAPGVRWDEDLPPWPEYWMHQLGSAERPRVDGPYLDVEEFAERVAAMLNPAPRTLNPAPRTLDPGP